MHKTIIQQVALIRSENGDFQLKVGQSRVYLPAEIARELIDAAHEHAMFELRSAEFKIERLKHVLGDDSTDLKATLRIKHL